MSKSGNWSTEVSLHGLHRKGKESTYQHTVAPTGNSHLRP